MYLNVYMPLLQTPAGVAYYLRATCAMYAVIKCRHRP